LTKLPVLIIAGRTTVRTENSLGQLLSETNTDIASGLTLESYTITEMDELGRPTRIDYNDGTNDQKTYTCCGVDWEKDRNGATTNYTYDALKRVQSTTRGGLTMIYSYDGSGRTLTTTRHGSDGSDIVIETNTYDLAGRKNKQPGCAE